jgi:sporulation protein YlmC with PRC-barrel domain
MKTLLPLKQAALATAVAAALALPAAADIGRTGAAAQQQPAYGTTQAQTQSPQLQSPQIHSPQIQSQARDDVRLSEVLGMEVRDRSGDKLGQVKDMVLDLNENRLHYVVVQPEGSDQLFALPTRAFESDPRSQRLIVDAARSDFEQARGFQAGDRWPGMADAEYWNRIHRQFGGQMALDHGRQQALRRASELLRTDIVDRSGDHVGEIRDVVVNLNNGEVHYTVLSFDDQRMPGRLAALPFGVLEPAYGRDALMLNMSPEQVAQAPSFSEDRWPDLADPGFRDTVARTMVIIVQQPATAQARDQTGTGVVGMQQPGQQDRATGQERPLTGPQTQVQDTTLMPDSARTAEQLQRPQAEQRALQQDIQQQQAGQLPERLEVPGPQTQRDLQPAAPQARTDAPTPQIDGRPFTEESFKRLDRDGDGRISAEEARMDPTFMAAWSDLDRNNTGYVTLEDVRQYRQQRGFQ